MHNITTTRRLLNVEANGDILVAALLLNIVLEFGVGTAVTVAPTGFATIEVSQASCLAHIYHLPTFELITPCWDVGEAATPPELLTGVLSLPPAVTVTRLNVTMAGTSPELVIGVTAATALVFVGYGP